MKWQEPAVPRSAVMMIPVDPSGGMLMMHRSNNVRSAKDVWSFPSGLQEIGETLRQTARRELREEYELEARASKLLGVYENIAGDGMDQPDQYHWVITLLGVVVDDVKESTNKEPDKHDRMLVACYEEMLSERFWMIYTFHRSFHDYMGANRRRVVGDIEDLLRSYADAYRRRP